MVVATVVVLLMAFLLFFFLFKIEKRQRLEKHQQTQQELQKKRLELLHKQDKIKRLQEAKRKQELSQVAKFRKEEFPFTSEDSDIMSDWKTNDCDHDSQEQIERQWRALYGTIPICIDPPTNSGFFLGTRRTTVYYTTLCTCDCPDHQNTLHPCKHMYRLFHEIAKGSFEENPLVCLSTEEYRDFLLLDTNLKLEFIEIAYRIACTCSGKLQFHLNLNLSKLISLEYFVITDKPDYQSLLNKRTKDQIILALAKRSVEGWRPSWSKVKLVDWIISSRPDFLEKEYRTYAVIGFDDSVASFGKMIAESQRHYTRTFIKSLKLFDGYD